MIRSPLLTMTIVPYSLVISCYEKFEKGSNIFPGKFGAVFRTGEPDTRDTHGCKSTLVSRKYTGFHLHSLCFAQTGM